MSLTQELKELAIEVGLDVVGVTSADPLSDAAERMKQQVRRGFRPKWKIRDMDVYCNPKTVLPEAKSVVVVAESYPLEDLAEHGKDTESRGKISKHAWSNYYYDVRGKLGKLADFLKKKAGDDVRITFDSNGKLAEKPMAWRAGVGWYGKHGIIVTKEYGSRIVLGELITDVKLNDDEPLENLCGDCTICIDACPTGAIVDSFILDVSKCLQYITARPIMISAEVREIWGDRLYGCTTCQDLCPRNRDVKPRMKKVEYGYIGSSLPLIPLLEQTEREYRKQFIESMIGGPRTNFRAMQRNALVALGNIGDPKAVPILSQTLKRSRNQLLQVHSAWALGKIGGSEARSVLSGALGKKLSPRLREEVQIALKRCGG